jgi:Uncharacterised nucleotidyltransferase
VSVMAPQFWAAVDELVTRAPGIGALRHHRLELLAARQLRARGLDVDSGLRDAERITAMRALAVPHLLTMMRSAVDGPLVLMKGPEVAAIYPSAECRPFGDLDVLTPDAGAAFAALRGAGFIEVGKCDAAHHAPPLALPGVPLTIELHSTVKWICGLPKPQNHELLGLTQPSRTGVEDIEGFVPAAHAVLLAVHAWAHGPLQCLGQLIDIAAALSEADLNQADEIARDWGCSRLWQTTSAAIDALLARRAPSMPLRTWARHLLSSREPRVAERALARIAAPAWALPGRAAPAAVGAEVLKVARRYEWENRDEQWLRSRQALRHPFRTVSEFRA